MNKGLKINQIVKYQTKSMYLKERERINSIWHSIFSFAGFVALIFSALDLFVIYDMIEQVSIGRIATNFILALVLCVSENFLGIIITRYSYDEKYKLDSRASFYKIFFSSILIIIFVIMIYFRYEYTFGTEHSSNMLFSSLGETQTANVSTFLLLCAEPIISTLIAMWISSKTSDRINEIINLNNNRMESLVEEISEINSTNSIIEKAIVDEDRFKKEQLDLNKERLDKYYKQVDLYEEKMKNEARKVLVEKLQTISAVEELLGK